MGKKTGLEPEFMIEVAMGGASLVELCKKHGVEYERASELMESAGYRRELEKLRGKVDGGAMAFDSRVLARLGDALDAILSVMDDEEVGARERMDAAKLVLQMGGKLNKAKESGVAAAGPSLTIVNGNVSVGAVEKVKEVVEIKMPKLPMRLDGKSD